jgi:hypothetical protein
MAGKLAGVCMMCERGVAAGALRDPAAIATEYVGCGTAAVEKEDSLMSRLKSLVERFLQRSAEDRAIARFQLLAHVDHMNRGQVDIASISRGVLIAVLDPQAFRLLCEALAVPQNPLREFY